jgi:outer membrane protein assembly factor BamD (BamD/ComL family)
VGRNWSGEADLIYTQGLDYIKEKKWDLAEKALQDLTKMKPNLPVEWQLRVDEFKKAYDVAKAAKMLNDAKLPGM